MKRILFLFLFAFTLWFTAQSQTEAGKTHTIQKVKVFPNPATNVVNVLGLQNSERAEIVISDAYGNVVIRHNWAIRNNALNIPITSLGSGIYLVNIRSQEQRVQTKFYKQ